MQENFDKAKQLIDASNNILLTMHERMDGDDGGALLALDSHLKKMGKNVVCAIKKRVPPSLAFLFGSHLIVDDIEHDNFDLVITFGCSNIERTGSLKIKNLFLSNDRNQNLKVINIDHHPDNEMFGDVNVVDSHKSSVAELVYDFFLYNHWPISKPVAECLLTGIITDTGCFMHSNTQKTTLEAAGNLMKKGALAEKIISHTFRAKNVSTLKAWGKALANLKYDPKTKIIYSLITDQDLNELGQLPQSAFEGLAETLNTYPEAKFAMFLRQDGEVIKGSLRTEPFKKTDVSNIAKFFGGGGHKMAAGFSVSGRLVRDEAGKWTVV